FDLGRLVIGQSIQARFVRQTELRSALLYCGTSKLLRVLPQHNFARCGGGGKLHLRNLPRLERPRRGIFRAGRLQSPIQKWNERLVNRPGRVFAIQAERSDKKLSLQFSPLKEQTIAMFTKDERHCLTALEPKIFEELDAHQVSIVRRKKRMKDWMIRKHELKFLGPVLTRVHGALDFKSKLF